jgi:hypothetical protein
MVSRAEGGEFLPKGRQELTSLRTGPSGTIGRTQVPLGTRFKVEAFGQLKLTRDARYLNGRDSSLEAEGQAAVISTSTGVMEDRIARDIKGPAIGLVASLLYT